MSANDLDVAIANFRAGVFSAVTGEELLPGQWSDEDWKRLFQFATTRVVAAGDALIRRGEPDRTLYFVLRGSLEITAHSGDGISMGPISLAGPGTVLGELSFFDGNSRSASAWAADDCEVAAMTPDQYAAFERDQPGLARDLLFALGRVLAARLRRTTARVAR
jgi:CRP/FNR family transcriptional regulator, cyclic AMP receptor protein